MQLCQYRKVTGGFCRTWWLEMISSRFFDVVDFSRCMTALCWFEWFHFEISFAPSWVPLCCSVVSDCVVFWIVFSSVSFAVIWRGRRPRLTQVRNSVDTDLFCCVTWCFICFSRGALIIAARRLKFRCVAMPRPHRLWILISIVNLPVDQTIRPMLHLVMLYGVENKYT